MGSVLKDFIPPADVGGPDIRRRVVIAPGVASRIWSQGVEVDTYGSTFTDAPGRDNKTFTLADGRKLPVRVAANGLRWLDFNVRPTVSAIATLTACFVADPLDWQRRDVLTRVTGVGKRYVPLAQIEFLRLWHSAPVLVCHGFTTPSAMDKDRSGNASR